MDRIEDNEDYGRQRNIENTEEQTDEDEFSEYLISNDVCNYVDCMIRHLEGISENDAISSGVPSFDRFINGGFHRNEYMVIGARPGVGKTSFIVTLIRNMLSEGKRVAFFSLEMSKQDITKRLIASYARISLRSICDFDLIDEDSMVRIVDAANKLYSQPIYIIDTPAIKLDELKEKARGIRPEVHCILIDHIGLIDTGLDINIPRCEKIAVVSSALKQLADELSVPIICSLQLPRDHLHRDPSVSNLRDMSCVVQNADTALFIHRKTTRSKWEKQEDLRDGEGNPVIQVVKIIIEKNRTGETGSFELGMNTNTVSFEEITQYQ